MKKWFVRHSGFNDITIVDENGYCIAEVNWNRPDTEKNAELISQVPEMLKLLAGKAY
jgi:hypothetical protein